MGGDWCQMGGDFLAKPLDPEGPPPAVTTLMVILHTIIIGNMFNNRSFISFSF